MVQQSVKKCKYLCGKYIKFTQKEGTFSTGFFEVDRVNDLLTNEPTDAVTNIEHTYARCAKLLKAQGLTDSEIEERFKALR